MKKHVLFPIILLTCLVAFSTANAQTQYPGYLQIYDNPDETITVTAHGHAGFVTINGTTYGDSTGTQTVPEGTTSGIDILWGNDFGFIADKKVYFTEENNPAIVSDILTLHFLPQAYVYANYWSHLYATFQSGVDQSLSSFVIQPSDYVTSEAAGTLGFSDTPGTSVDPGWGGNSTFAGNVYFPAGTEAVVPEPSTFIAGALLALPFGLQGVRRLRNRKSVA